MGVFRFAQNPRNRLKDLVAGDCNAPNVFHLPFRLALTAGHSHMIPVLLRLLSKILSFNDFHSPGLQAAKPTRRSGRLRVILDYTRIWALREEAHLSWRAISKQLGAGTTTVRRAYFNGKSSGEASSSGSNDRAPSLGSKGRNPSGGLQ